MDQSEILISYKSSFLPLFVDPEFALQAKSQNKLYNESPKEGGSVNFLSKHLLGPLRLAASVEAGGSFAFPGIQTRGKPPGAEAEPKCTCRGRTVLQVISCILGFLGGPVVRSFVRPSGPRKWGHH